MKIDAAFGTGPARAVANTRLPAPLGRHDLAFSETLYVAYIFVNFFYTLEHHVSSYYFLAASIAAAALLFLGRNRPLFLLMVAAQAIGILSRQMQSNHLLIDTVLCVGLLGCYLRTALTQRTLLPPTAIWFSAAAPLGRWLLIGMYFYGVFHKINADFLNPEVSCAVVLLRAYDLPLGAHDLPAVQYAAMYGTLLIETFSAACLMMPRFRYYGVVVGVVFHWAIGFNPYQSYIAFSLLSIFLHSLYLPADFLSRISRSPATAHMAAALGRLEARALAVAAAMLALVAVDRMVLWLAFGVGLTALILAFGREHRPFAPMGAGLAPRSALLAALAALFFLNGALPYLGFKTGQAISMFSNLTTEGGESNHLIVQRVGGLFPHQARIAEIISSEDPWLATLPAQGLGLVEWALLDRFERTGLPVSYAVGGERLNLDASMRDRVAAELPPRFVRQLFPFKPVNLTRPRPCDR